MTAATLDRTRTPTLVDERIAEIFHTASVLIRDHGWLRGYYGDCDKGFCVEGAIQNAAHCLFEEQGVAFVNRMIFAAVRSFRRTIGERHIPWWNDRVGRTVRQVLFALEDARLDALQIGAV